MGKKNQCTRIGLVKPSTTLQWAQWLWREEALLPAHSLMLPHKSSSGNTGRPPASARHSGGGPAKLSGPVRNGYGQGPPWTGPSQEAVWKCTVMLISRERVADGSQEKTTSGSPMWQLCIGKWQLLTGTELPATHVTKAAMRVAGLGRTKCFLLSVFLHPWAAQAKQ